MKRRRLSRILIAICLLLYGCGMEKQNTDDFRAEYQAEADAEQTADNAADENGVEQTTQNYADGSGGQSEQKDGGSANAAGQKGETAADELVLQKGSPQLAKMVEEQAKVLEEYAAFLAEYEPQQENEQQPPRFALLFLDGDDVPELIVIEGTAHAQGASVYTIQKGVALLLGEYGQYGALGYREKEGILFDDYDTQGDIFSRVYQIKGNQAVLLQSYDSIEPPYSGQEEELEYTYPGKSHTYPGGWGEETTYTGTLYFAGAAHGVSALSDSYGSYRKIDGVMDFGSRKYLFFYTELIVTSNNTELWTVRDGKPVEEGGIFRNEQVVYRDKYPREDFEVWVDAYDYDCEKNGFDNGEDMWLGHTWKPYFYYYDQFEDRIKAYGGEKISKDAFVKLSGTNIIEEIEAKGYTVGEIIHWENDVVTINYHYAKIWGEDEESTVYYYENVIWDNQVKDYWRKEERGVTSWENAGEGGSYKLTYFENQEKWRMQGTVNR